MFTPAQLKGFVEKTARMAPYLYREAQVEQATRIEVDEAYWAIIKQLIPLNLEHGVILPRGYWWASGSRELWIDGGQGGIRVANYSHRQDDFLKAVRDGWLEELGKWLHKRTTDRAKVI